MIITSIHWALESRELILNPTSYGISDYVAYYVWLYMKAN